MWQIFLILPIFSNSYQLYLKIDTLLTLTIFGTATHVSNCDSLFYLWPIFLTLAHYSNSALFFSAWHILPTLTHFSNKDPFLCGISPTHSQRQRYLFIYLFICPLIEVLVTWFLVWVFRREKSGFQYTMSRLCFVGGHYFSQLWVFCWFWRFFALCF